MPEPVTEELVRRSERAYRLFKEGAPEFLDELHPEIEWYVPDALPSGGDLKGVDEVVHFLTSMVELWDEARPEPEEFLPFDDKLIVLGTWHGRARSTGVRVDVPFAHLQQFRDGRLVLFRNYIDSAKVLRSLEEPPP